MEAWLDGEFVAADSVTVPVMAHSFSRGSAVFEVLDLVSTEAGPALFRMNAHVERLFGSAKCMHMELPLDRAGLAQAVVETARRCGPARAVIKVFAYYNTAQFAFVPQGASVSVAVFCFDFAEAIGCSFGEAIRPVTAGIAKVCKHSPACVNVHAKVAGHYVSPFLATLDVRQRGFDEAILLNEDGVVTEGALANVFFVRGDVLRGAPAETVLGGITRDSVIEIARDQNVPYQECDMTADDARGSDEAFFSGSCIRVKPVRAIDGVDVGTGCPGPVTKLIQAWLEEVYAGRSRKYDRWLTRL